MENINSIPPLFTIGLHADWGDTQWIRVDLPAHDVDSFNRLPNIVEHRGLHYGKTHYLPTMGWASYSTKHVHHWTHCTPVFSIGDATQISSM